MFLICLSPNRIRMKAGLSSGGKGGKIIFGIGVGFTILFLVLYGLLKYGS